MSNWSNKYDKLQEIGEGSSGKIYKIYSKETNQILAAKIINVQQQNGDLQSIQQQIKIMSSCNHINIIKCIGVQIYAGEVWILLQYCQGHSLADIMKSRKTTYTQQEISSIMKQVIEGLTYLHKKNIVHRDIKASNLLYQKGVVKIADFGISIVNQNNISQSKFGRFGSPYWMSPQILSHSIYNQKTDIWALGITAIQLAEGQPPYSHQHPFRAIYSIQTHPPQGLSKPQNWSKLFNNFVKNCLNTQYESRPTAQILTLNEFICQSQKNNKIQKSPQSQSNQSQDTIIMHQDIPKSIWQKSYPQSTQKDRDLNYSITDTVIIKEYPNEQDLSLRFQQNIETLFPLRQASQKSNLPQPNKQISLESRQKRVKQLMQQMQDEVKQVRKKYMAKIRGMYKGNDINKQNKAWNSPVKKLKDKYREISNKQQSKLSSDMIKMMY